MYIYIYIYMYIYIYIYIYIYFKTEVLSESFSGLCRTKLVPSKLCP